RPPRLEREVVAVRRPLVVAGLAAERARDDAADGVLASEDLARGPARGVELVERHRLLVRRDLEDRVGRRIDDPLARPLVLLVESADGPSDVAERVGAFVSEVRRVRQGTRTDGVEHDDARARHAAILGAVATALGLIGIVFFIASVIALAAAVTYAVVKLVPA